MSRPYYTMIVKYGDLWGPEFGDYERQYVVDEVWDCHPDSDTTEVRIIKTGDCQSQIDEAIAVLNRGDN